MLYRPFTGCDELWSVSIFVLQWTLVYYQSSCKKFACNELYCMCVFFHKLCLVLWTPIYIELQPIMSTESAMNIIVNSGVWWTLVCDELWPVCCRQYWTFVIKSNLFELWALIKSRLPRTLFCDNLGPCYDPPSVMNYLVSIIIFYET